MISKDEWEHYNMNNDGHKAPRCFYCNVGINPKHGGDSYFTIEQVSSQHYLGKINTYRRLYFCTTCFTSIAGDTYKVALK